MADKGKGKRVAHSPPPSPPSRPNPQRSAAIGPASLDVIQDPHSPLQADPEPITYAPPLLPIPASFMLSSSTDYNARLEALERSLADEEEGRIPEGLLQGPQINVSSAGKKRRVLPKTTEARIQDVASVAIPPTLMPLPFTTEYQGFDPWWRKSDLLEQMTTTPAIVTTPPRLTPSPSNTGAAIMLTHGEESTLPQSPTAADLRAINQTTDKGAVMSPTTQNPPCDNALFTSHDPKALDTKGKEIASRTTSHSPDLSLKLPLRSPEAISLHDNIPPSPSYTTVSIKQKNPQPPQQSDGTSTAADEPRIEGGSLSHPPHPLGHSPEVANPTERTSASPPLKPPSSFRPKSPPYNNKESGEEVDRSTSSDDYPLEFSQDSAYRQVTPPTSSPSTSFSFSKSDALTSPLPQRQDTTAQSPLLKSPQLKANFPLNSSKSPTLPASSLIFRRPSIASPTSPTNMSTDKQVSNSVAKPPSLVRSPVESLPTRNKSFTKSSSTSALPKRAGDTIDLLSDSEGSSSNLVRLRKKRVSSDRDLHRAMSGMIEHELRSQERAATTPGTKDVKGLHRAMTGMIEDELRSQKNVVASGSHNTASLNQTGTSSDANAASTRGKSKKGKEPIQTIVGSLSSRKRPLSKTSSSKEIVRPRPQLVLAENPPGQGEKSVINLDSDIEEDEEPGAITLEGVSSTKTRQTSPPHTGALAGVRIYAIPVGMDKVVYDLSRDRVRQMKGQWLGAPTKILSINQTVQESMPPLDQELTTHIVTALSNIDTVKKLLKVDMIKPSIAVVNSTWLQDTILFHKPMDPSKYSIKRPEIIIPVAKDSPTSATPPREAPTKKTTREAGKHAASSSKDASKVVSKEQSEFDEIMLAIQEGSLEEPEPSEMEEEDVDELPAEGPEKKVLEVVAHPAKENEEVLLQIISSGKKEGKRRFGKRPEPTYNKAILEQLKVLLDYYDEHKTRGSKEQYKVINYRKAMTAIRALDYEITSEEMALKVPRVGKKLAQKIGECISFGRIKKLDHLDWDVDRKSVESLFKGIYGVGSEKATEWYNQGLRTLDDIRKVPNLNQNQISGLKYYDDLQKRIPRTEVEKIGTVVRESAQRLHPDIDVQVTGSYRRGKQDCGDVDIVVTRPNINNGDELFLIMEHILTDLIQQDFLVDHLSKPSYDESMANALKHFKYMGVCRLPTESGGSTPYPHRHIDILVVPFDHHGAVLIYFTGNDICNRSMRFLAQKRGMSLSDKGLFVNVIRDRKRNKISKGQWVAGRTEKEVFDYLNIAYLEPHEREC